MFTIKIVKVTLSNSPTTKTFIQYSRDHSDCASCVDVFRLEDLKVKLHEEINPCITKHRNTSTDDNTFIPAYVQLMYIHACIHIKTSAPLGAWNCYFPLFQTDRPTDRQIHRKVSLSITYSLQKGRFEPAEVPIASSGPLFYDICVSKTCLGKMRWNLIDYELDFSFRTRPRVADYPTRMIE